jgi:hypothetical protein
MSIAFAIFMSVQYILSQLQLKDAVGQISVQKADRKTLIFAKLFVDKFLLAQGTVGFEDRLKLENAVRDINDPAIFKQWQKFTDSTDDREAQTAAGDLFNLLFNRLEK